LTGTELFKESIDEQVHSPAEVRFCKVLKKGYNSALFWQREREDIFHRNKKRRAMWGFLELPGIPGGQKVSDLGLCIL
jgi:hypothetical protein